VQTAFFKDQVRIAQSTLSNLVYKNQLTLHRAKIAIYSETNTKHTNTVWQNGKFFNVKPVGASHNKYALTG
jgi:hypothetical protein